MNDLSFQPAAIATDPLIGCALQLDAAGAALNALCSGDESPAFYDAERLYSEAFDAFTRQLERSTGLHADQLRALLDGRPAQPPLAWTFRTNAVHLDADCMDEPEPRRAPGLSSRDRRDFLMLAIGIAAIAAIAAASSLWAALS